MPRRINEVNPKGDWEEKEMEADRKLERTKLIVEAASETVVLQKENQRLSAKRMEAGVIRKAQYAESVAAVKKAEWEELQAHLGYRLVLAELDRITGRLHASLR